MRRYEIVGRDAYIDQSKRYRYWLSRTISSLEIGVELSGRAVFVMLNPSTADAELDDNTIRRCAGFTYEWRCLELVVVNLFAFRSTNPKKLYGVADPIGVENDRWIQEKTEKAHVVVAAWGCHGRHLGRAREVAAMMAKLGRKIHHLGLTKDGFPSHPLYLPNSTRLVELVGA